MYYLLMYYLYYLLLVLLLVMYYLLKKNSLLKIVFLPPGVAIIACSFWRIAAKFHYFLHVAVLVALQPSATLAWSGSSHSMLWAVESTVTSVLLQLSWCEGVVSCEVTAQWSLGIMDHTVQFTAKNDLLSIFF